MLGKYKKIFLFLIMVFFTTKSFGASNKLAYEFSFNDLDGSQMKLSEYKDKIIVIVNVASQCGFTNQYEDMQTMWDKYQNKGLIIIGVPSNDFGNQEPGSSSEIKNFCEAKFGITFPMTEKVSVKGSDAHPFYLWAKEDYGSGAVPKWNFHKIVIGKNGKIIDTFASITKPTSKKFVKLIEENLN
jgi:glutathione peroxidase